jgi:hypothetical protein
MCGLNWYIISRGISERTHGLNFMYRPNRYLFTYFLFIYLFICSLFSDAFQYLRLYSVE